MGADLIELRKILINAGIDDLLEKMDNGLLKNTQVCQLVKARCIIHSYITQSTSNDSLYLHEVSKGLIRSSTVAITCLPTLSDVGWVIPAVNGLHYNLKNEHLMKNNISFHQNQLKNDTWLTDISRNLNSSEIKLLNFLIYVKKTSGQESFQLLCLNGTIFSLDGEKRKCVQDELIDLPK